MGPRVWIAFIANGSETLGSYRGHSVTLVDGANPLDMNGSLVECLEVPSSIPHWGWQLVRGEQCEELFLLVTCFKATLVTLDQWAWAEPPGCTAACIGSKDNKLQYATFTACHVFCHKAPKSLGVCCSEHRKISKYCVTESGRNSDFSGERRVEQHPRFGFTDIWFWFLIFQQPSE